MLAVKDKALLKASIIYNVFQSKCKRRPIGYGGNAINK